MPLDRRDTADKSTWGDGPWQEEPDELLWSYGDVPCYIRRADEIGALCGYVGVPKSHPWYERSYSGIDDMVRVHGGLTYSGHVGDDALAARIGRDFWWFGFDCAHAWDLSPGIAALLGRPERGVSGRDVYRPIEYVSVECEDLAQQCIAAWQATTDMQRLRELDFEPSDG